MSLPSITLPALDVLLICAREDIEAAHEAALFLNVDFWGDEGDEGLTHTDLDEAIEARLDACHPDVPEHLEVYGYRRLALLSPPMDADTLVEFVYERLDEDFNGGDNPSEPTPDVMAAALAFLAVVRREYVPWNCEPVVKVTLDAADVRRKIAERWPSTCGDGQ